MEIKYQKYKKCIKSYDYYLNNALSDYKQKQDNLIKDANENEATDGIGWHLAISRPGSTECGLMARFLNAGYPFFRLFYKSN